MTDKGENVIGHKCTLEDGRRVELARGKENYYIRFSSPLEEDFDLKEMRDGTAYVEDGFRCTEVRLSPETMHTLVAMFLNRDDTRLDLQIRDHPGES